MRKENGITLIGLVVTIIVLIILASIGTYTGLNSVREAKFTKFRTVLEIMQAQVNLLSEKYKEEIGTEFTGVGKDIPADFLSEEGGVGGYLSNINENYDSKVSTEVSDYRYFDEEVLKNLGVDYSETEFLVDLKNRIAIATKPLKYEGVLCYTINQTIVKGKAPETGGFKRTENVTVENIKYQKTNSGYQITLENIQCSEYVSKYDVEYREVNDKVSKIERGLTSNNYTFTVDKHGVYFIKIKDAAGQTTEREELVVSIYDGVKFNTATKVKMVKSIDDTSVTVDEVAIPAGFTISGVESECAKSILGVAPENEKKYTIDDGVVTYLNPSSSINWTNAYDVEDAQESYDQFVWVPVPNAILDLSDNLPALENDDSIKLAVQNQINADIYPMAIKNADGNYFGILYGFNLNNSKLEVIPYGDWTPKSKTLFMEPGYSINDDKEANLAQINGILNTNYTNTTNFGNALQLEFNKMVQKVDENKGFWIGRYETSEMSNNTTTSYTSSNEIKVRVVKAATNGLNNITWYRMLGQQQIYSKKAGIKLTSNMMWGSQWDQIMIWMKEVKNNSQNTYYVKKSTGMGNYNVSGVDDGWSAINAPAPTGYKESYKVKNIYDLAGNLRELTQNSVGLVHVVNRRR